MSVENSEAKKNSFWNKLADIGDWFDRQVYGIKAKLFIYLALTTILLPSVIGILADWGIVNPLFYDKSNRLLTLVLFLYILISIFSWFSIWRDENGIWSWKTALPILKISLIESSKSFLSIFKGDKFEIIYNLGLRVLVVGVVLLGVGNMLCVFNDFSGLAFDDYKIAFWFLDAGFLLFILGLLTFALSLVLDKEDKLINRIKNDLSIKKTRSKVKFSDTSQLVVNVADVNQLELIKSKNNDVVLNQVLDCIKSWTPRTWHDENEYQVSLYHKFHRDYPDLTVMMEYPLGGKRRADLVINESLMIEMKKDFKSQNEINRASGQLEQYIDDWKELGNGPIMLLICKDNFETVKQPLENIISKKKVFKDDIIAVLGNDTKH
ncbi:MAG: hypothetical protein R2780_03270 [Crocinitomicaceae bacterium]